MLRFVFGNLRPLKSLKVTKTLEYLSYEEGLRELEKRKFREILSMRINT